MNTTDSDAVKKQGLIFQPSSTCIFGCRESWPLCGIASLLIKTHLCPSKTVMKEKLQIFISNKSFRLQAKA